MESNEKTKRSRDISNLLERIEDLRKAMGMSQAQFSRLLGLKPSTYASNVGSKQARPGASMLLEISNNTRVNAVWLLTGEGPMFRDEAAVPGTDDTVGHLREMVATQREALAAQREALEVLKRERDALAAQVEELGDRLKRVEGASRADSAQEG